MRENALLSPQRARRRDEDSHERQIITTAPNVMWAIDATQVTTVEHGKVWIFGVAEHWNAEFLGWHVTKRGTRLPASGRCRRALGHPGARHGRPPAVPSSLRRRRPRDCAAPRPRAGAPTPPAAWGGGSNVMADHFQQQARFWGISPSSGFVGEPETNRVIERLFRTLKDQPIHGRVFQTIDEVRDAIRDFAACRNAEWLIEKNGYRSPLDMRAARLDTNLRRAAWCNRVSRTPGAVHDFFAVIPPSSQ